MAVGPAFLSPSSAVSGLPLQLHTWSPAAAAWPASPTGLQLPVRRAPRQAGQPPALAASRGAGAAALVSAALWLRAQRQSRRTRRRGMDEGHYSFDGLYKPSVSADDIHKTKGSNQKKLPRWRKDDLEMYKDERYTKQMDYTRKKRNDGSRGGGQFRPQKIDVQEERDLQSKELRTRLMRPRFSQEEAKKDLELLGMRTLHKDLPAIGSGMVCLSKFLSHCGVCSRRSATDMVLEGRVTINGEPCINVATQINPQEDVVLFDGKPIKLKTLGELVWLMVYKPKGYVCTVDDPKGRKTIMDCVPESKKRRILPVGRIDRQASGLVIMTNDMEWMTILTHPRHEHEKTYMVRVCGMPNKDKLYAISRGLELPDEKRRLLPVDIEVMDEPDKNDLVLLRVILRQGLYRQIRRMFEYVGHPVYAIKRIQFGFVRLDKELKAGECRALTTKEIRRLKGMTIQQRPKPPPFALDGHNTPRDLTRSLQSSGGRGLMTITEDDIDSLNVDDFDGDFDEPAPRRKPRWRDQGRDQPAAGSNRSFAEALESYRAEPTGRNAAGSGGDARPGNVKDLQALSAGFAAQPTSGGDASDSERIREQLFEELDARSGRGK